ncbi:MAG: hypothetical protein GX446_10645 [Chthonomonadales bacterium]|nr:hypothetical protein [Chthonomonadales bacterium]
MVERSAVLLIALAVVRPPRSGADASVALQAAIDQVADGSGGTIFLPCGRYRRETPVTLKEGVALRGDRPKVGPDASGVWRPLKGPATILMPVHGRWSADGPAGITVERGTGLCDLVVCYPDQKPGVLRGGCGLRPSSCGGPPDRRYPLAKRDASACDNLLASSDGSVSGVVVPEIGSAILQRDPQPVRGPKWRRRPAGWPGRQIGKSAVERQRALLRAEAPCRRDGTG